MGDGGVNASASPVTISDVLPAGSKRPRSEGSPVVSRSEAANLMSCTLVTLALHLPARSRSRRSNVCEVTIEVNVKAEAQQRRTRHR